MKQETVSGSGISWAIWKSAPRSRQTTTPAPRHSVFYRPDALPAAQLTASKCWRQNSTKGKALKAKHWKQSIEGKALKAYVSAVKLYLTALKDDCCMAVWPLLITNHNHNYHLNGHIPSEPRLISPLSFKVARNPVFNRTVRFFVQGSVDNFTQNSTSERLVFYASCDHR